MRNANACVVCTPFVGLGFDLSQVVLAAGRMRLMRVDHPKPFTDRPETTAPAWGYGLMLALSRETMGS